MTPSPTRTSRSLPGPAPLRRLHGAGERSAADLPVAIFVNAYAHFVAQIRNAIGIRPIRFSRGVDFLVTKRRDLGVGPTSQFLIVRMKIRNGLHPICSFA